MGNLLKYLLIGLFILIVATWIITVKRTCNERQLKDPLINESPISSTSEGDGEDGEDIYSDGEDADLEDLYEEVINEGEDEEKSDISGEGDGEANGEGDGDALAERNAAANEAKAKATLEKSEAAPVTAKSTSSNSVKKYLIIAASYLSEYNAEEGKKTLKKQGYNDAEIVVFRNSQYHTLCVDRTNSLTAAHNMRDKIKNISGFEEAYVHTRRLKRK